MLALQHPDLVRRLVLVGTGPSGGEGMAQQPPEVAALFSKRDELGERMWLPIMFSPSKASQATGRALIDRITARSADRDPWVSTETIAAHRAAARAWGTTNIGDFGYLHHIRQPTLVVNGNHDIVIPTVNSYHLYQNIPDAQLWLLPDASHGSHFQYPRRFVRRVVDFLDVEPLEDQRVTAGPSDRSPESR
jgi:pimeloyl-ACP methyl ester carboxylesterase